MSRYLSFDEILEIHAEMVHKFGGNPGVRDVGALLAAVARPQNGYYADPIEEAAALFESLSQNHGLLDGNKRTAMTSAAVFLLLNGYELLFDDTEAYHWMIGLYNTGALNKTAVDPWLRQHARRR